MSLLVSAGAAFTLVCMASSLLISLLEGRLRLHRLAAAARARLLLVLALLPFLLGAVVVTLTLLTPLVGDDHCLAHPTGHPHLCPLHRASEVAPLLATIAFTGAMYYGSRILLALRSQLRARRARLALRLLAREEGDLHILRTDEPRAFVLGLWTPDLYVSQGLLALDERAAVLAHERAHRRRRDPMRVALATVGFAFHLPATARQLKRALRQSHELAADAEAAEAVGHHQLAKALIQLARSRVRAPKLAAPMTGGDLEERVRALLEPPRAVGNPTATQLTLWTAGLFGVLIALMQPLHHAIETIIGAFGI